MATGWDTSRVVCGPADVRVDGVSVGRTQGPVRACVSPVLREETYASSGATPAEYVVVGVRAELVVPMADYVLENVLLAMPHAGYCAGYAALGPLPGGRLSEEAASVTVHPLAKPDGDSSQDVTLHRAVCVGVVELEYSQKGERLMEARFVGLVDFSRTDGDLVARIGAPGR
jgi:hypothetical protein